MVAKWYELSWVEWLSVATVPLAVIGFYLTLRQLAKTRDAAESAQRAVTITRKQLAANQLLILVPQLKWLAGELDAAIERDDPGLTRRHLDNWRWQAGHIHGLLIKDSAAGRRRTKELQDSVALAFTASSALMEGKRPVLDACRQARESIGKVCNELSIWVGQQSAQTRGEAE